MGRGAPALSSRPPYPWRAESGRVETVFLCGRSHLVTVRASRSGLICVLVKPSVSTVVLPEDKLGVDVFAHSSLLRGLLDAFPPLSAILPLLPRVHMERQTLVLGAPERPGSPWFPVLMEMVIRDAWPLPLLPEALSQAQGRIAAPPWIKGPLKARLLRGTSKRGEACLTRSSTRSSQPPTHLPTLKVLRPAGKRFSSSCAGKNLDMVCCWVEELLVLLQTLLDQGLAACTVHGYAAPALARFPYGIVVIKGADPRAQVIGGESQNRQSNFRL